MKKTAEQRLYAFVRERRSVRSRKIAVGILAAAVVCSTFFSMALPGISMDDSCKQLDCDVRPHIHDAQCYDAQGHISCGQTELLVHTHDANCFDANGELVCQLAEIGAHTHDANCFDETGSLLCTKWEIEMHQHTETCYNDENELVCGLDHQYTAVRVQRDASDAPILDENGSRMPEYIAVPAHQHTDACFHTEACEEINKPATVEAEEPEEENTIAADTDQAVPEEEPQAEDPTNLRFAGDASTCALEDDERKIYGKKTTAVPFDGTNGGMKIYDGASRGSIKVENGQFVLPDTISAPNSNRYPVMLKGWVNVYDESYYQPGEIVPYDGNQKYLFYADWVGTDAAYNNGQDTDALGGYMTDGRYATTIDGERVWNRFSVVDTSAFVQTHLFDYNELFNLMSAHYTDSGWIADRSGDETIDFTFYDSRVAEGSLGKLSNLDGRNTWTKDRSIWQGLYTEQLRELLFDPAKEVIGKTYLGTADGLFYYNATQDYYEYDSAYHAASFHKQEQKIYLYKQPQYIGGKEEYGGFAPLNGEKDAYAAEGDQTNYWYGMRTEISFDLLGGMGDSRNKIDGKDMVFEFKGDDDVWVLIDGTLALDLGGIHDDSFGSINFATGEVRTEKNKSGTDTSYDFSALKSGSHTLTILYLERGATASNCKIQFRLIPSVSLGVQKIDEEDQRCCLEGAAFILRDRNDQYYKIGSSGNVEWTTDRKQAERLYTDRNGRLSFVGLAEADGYVLEEIQAPTNYQIGLGTITFHAIETDEMVNGAKKLRVELAAAVDGVEVDRENNMTIRVSNKRVKQAIHMQKIDDNGDPVEGARYYLYEGGTLNEDRTQLLNAVERDDLKSDANGYLHPLNADADEIELKCGITYYLVEYDAPAGYRVNATPIPLTVVEQQDASERSKRCEIQLAYADGTPFAGTDGAAPNPQLTRESQIDGDTTVTTYRLIVTDERMFGLVFKKVDGNHQPLSGATFNVYKAAEADAAGAVMLRDQSGDTVYGILTAGGATTSEDNAGIIYTTDDGYGTYYLEETQTPDGFRRPTGVFTVTVGRDGAVLAGEEEWNHSAPVCENGTMQYTIEIPNDSGAVLPSTGGTGGMRFVLMGMLTALSGIGYMIYRKEGAEQHACRRDR